MTSNSVAAITGTGADMAPPSSVIKNLQILRFVAAFMVLIDHLQYEIASRSFIDANRFHPTHTLFWAGGVDIFFVISGFIMFTIGKDRFGAKGASWHFFARRLVRVVPVYWIFNILMLISLLLFSHRINHNNVSWVDVVTSFLFIPHHNSFGAYSPIITLGWTLNFEMFFYVLFALALLFRRVLGMILLGLALIGAAVLGMLKVPLPSPLDFWCNSIVLEFLFGIGLAWLYAKGYRMGALQGWSLVLLGFALVATAKAYGLDVTRLDMRALWMGLPALLICAGLVLSEKPGPGNWLARLFVFGGNISFAIYLSHPFSMNATAMVFDKLHLHDPYLYLALCLPAILVAAALVYLLLEKPLTALLNRQLVKP